MHPYEEIRSEILRRINNQIWPAGMAIPHEEQLAEEFNVARGTVRRAMADLVDAGLLERRRRAGTRVARRKSHSSTLTIPVVREEIENAGGQYGYKLLSSCFCGDEKDEQGVFSGAALRHLQCLHLSNGRPYQFEDRLLNLDAIPEARNIPFIDINPNEWLIADVPYSSVRTTLRAEMPTTQDKKYLKLKKEEPVFIVERHTHLDNVALTQVRMSHPAHRFQIMTTTDHLK